MSNFHTDYTEQQYYDVENKNFDSPDKLLIRRKHLDEFLNRNDLIIFWECLGEKRFMIEEMRDQKWSEWSGLLTLTDKGVVGEVKKYNKEKTE